MSRIDKINELLQSEIAQIINQEIFLKDSLITISYVDCSPDLRNAKVGISVLPDHHFGSALSKIRKNKGLLRKSLAKKLKIRQLPKIHWVIDPSQKNASEIEALI